MEEVKTVASLAKPKHRLFWKYAVILVALVGGALIVSGVIDLLFTYRHTRNTLAEFQREKATSAAAATIEQFLDDIEWQVQQAAKTPRVASSTRLELRRPDYLRLLKHVPAITDSATWMGRRNGGNAASRSAPVPRT